MDPFSLIAFVIGAAVGGVIGNRADDRFCQVMGPVTDRLLRGGPPVNHDLQRAVRKAYLQATLVVCEACLKALGVAPSAWRRDVRMLLARPSDEMRWLDAVRRAIGEELRRIPRADYVPPSTEAEKQVELLLQPKGTTGKQRTEELRAALKQSVLDELRQHHGEPPARFVEMVQRGWDDSEPDNIVTHLDWFDLLCAFFVYDLKTNEKVRTIFEGQLLAQLTVEGTPLTLEVFQATFEELGKAMVNRLEQLDAHLEKLRSEQAEGFAGVQGRLDEMLPSLALLPDVAAQQQTLAALLQEALRELRRRPLYERYAGWEVAGRVEELLREYTTLFVGREDTLAGLDAFLTENRSGVLVITARAGYGKTALLANWSRTRHGDGCFAAYHFFSHRSDVTRPLANGLRNLLRQLYIYHESPDESLPDDEIRLRETLYGIVRERGAHDSEPLVIVLDGLDEAERSFSPPFPTPLPDGVYVVVSARADEGDEPEYLRGWTEGAGRIHLDRLPRVAIAEWLRRTGEGELALFADDAAFVAQVDETTEGFPLYLRYLTEELAQAAKGGGDARVLLDQTPRGFGAYVRQQLKQLAQVEEVHRQREVQELFALLSVARGALSAADVEALTELTVWDLPALPWQVTRWFTMREKEDTTTYAFAHSLLADEFERALGRQAQKAKERLLDYCARWQEHRSPYALRHYAEHLLEAKRYDELYALARNEAFQQAQADTLADEPHAPLRTLQAALEGAMVQYDATKMAEFCLTHARRLIEITQESPLDALRTGHLERAWALADLHDIEHNVLWHLLLVWELKDTGRLEEARTTLERLLAKELPRLSDWQGEYAADLLSDALSVNAEAFMALQERL